MSHYAWRSIFASAINSKDIKLWCALQTSQNIIPAKQHYWENGEFKQTQITLILKFSP